MSLKLVIGGSATECPDESETECVARQLHQNGYRIFSDEVRALWKEKERLRLLNVDTLANSVRVPRAMTIEMEIAFCEVWFSKVRCIDDAEMDDAYSAMLSAVE